MTSCEYKPCNEPGEKLLPGIGLVCKKHNEHLSTIVNKNEKGRGRPPLSRSKIDHFLKNQKGIFKNRNFWKECRITTPTAIKYLKQLEVEGRIEKVGRGTWKIRSTT